MSTAQMTFVVPQGPCSRESFLRDMERTYTKDKFYMRLERDDYRMEERVVVQSRPGALDASPKYASIAEIDLLKKPTVPAAPAKSKLLLLEAV